MCRLFLKIMTLVILLSLSGISLPVQAQNLLGPITDHFQKKQVELGRDLFNRDWVAFPGRNPRGDGLGPVFNRVSCTGCHFMAGRGRPPEGPDEPFTSMVLRLGVTDRLGSHGHPAYGDQINDRAIPNIPPEGRPRVFYEEINGQYLDGERYKLRIPRYQLDGLNFGKLGPNIRFSGRVAQPLFGIGLLEAISLEELKMRADPQDQDGDGISGRLPNLPLESLGRFGWKSSQPDLLHQTAQALHEDMGLTNLLHPEQNCTLPQLACRVAAKSPEFEVDAVQLDQLVAYQRALAPPPQKADIPEEGARLFGEIGCAACHQPNWFISKDVWPPFLAGLDKKGQRMGQEIWPYTDLLLHDMGEGLSDGLYQGAASPVEWRTAPLWGLSQKQPLRLLHDGRARNVAEAILWHGGEALTARERFRSLPKSLRDELIAFVEAL